MTLRKGALDISGLAGGAFRDGQFRLFFVGIFFAVQAIWVQRVTLGWLAWERTGSAGFVGLVAGLSLAPALVLGPFFGVMADRVDIRRASFTTNGSMAAVLAALALALPWTGPGALVLAALAIGVISSAHHPVRMSLGPRLVPAAMVQHVVSITALNFNLARLVAPVLAGWVIATAGAGVALWLSVLCYVPMLLVLPRLRPRALPPRARASVLSDLVEGLRYAVTAPLVRSALLLTLSFATAVRGALEVLPVLADGAFGRGAAGLGVLTAAAGAGALGSAVLKAAGADAVGARLSPAVLWATMVGQGAVVAMGVAPAWPLAVLATALTGFCATWVGVSMQASIQSDLPDAYRGRVMSLWVVVGFGTVALGAFAIGALAEWIGIGAALAVAGLTGAAVQGALILGVHPRR
ncbi:MFS transporter [Roseicyclus persicicus]|uniref:MFS transporter n=1 Tax=Roseicyclus persicicus TaxID=2650661 RepID=A0A7X6GYZ5_9RHOB|nr:MFS transporter [Roseibacterium persicicum]NKX43841.1 MFS transporter [Roseibacterium persicicum]